MSKDSSNEKPYVELGNRLKEIRQKLQETREEAAGAVEIDTEKLAEFEKGADIPNQEILLLLISHYDLSDDVAKQLWTMAGYTNPAEIHSMDHPREHIDEKKDLPHPFAGQIEPAAKLMIVPVDGRIIYTDMVQVSTNNFGVIINFLQGANAKGHPAEVAKVGMSREHARSLIEILEKSLEKTNQKSLPSSEDTKDKK
jgi:transcriptional regulator with XRE-family HTH domain